MKITKVLNNNAVIVIDDNQEKIAIGNGVGFQKNKNDIVPNTIVEKLFVLDENKRFEQLLERIPEEHFNITEEIIKYAENQLQVEFNDHIRIVLTDHISFAIERHKEGIELQNKLKYEIKTLYRDEYNIGLWAIEHIKNQLGVDMGIDEAAFIALHIHTTKLKGGDLRETVRKATILNDVVEKIQELVDVSFKEGDIAYDRLITHLHFAIVRSEDRNLHTMDQDMLAMIQRKFPDAFEVAKQVGVFLRKNHQIDLPDEELGYIALHIERLKENKA
ncbi:MAG TPA: PRD domain-containing protein [Pseudogracilibacillus sp.]|nr:PRD domain-containing protein [Pseudogracilibacillus sp.]